MVVDDPEQAAAVVAAGGSVVLLVDPESSIPWADGPGRMALFLGNPHDPAARAAADSMDRELFRPAGG